MFQRHDMVYIAPWGREASVEYIKTSPKMDMVMAADLIRDGQIPGIVKRQEDPQRGSIEVGFASPLYSDGRRFRVSASVPQDSIIEKITPFELMNRLLTFRNIPKKEPLLEIVTAAETENISIGLFGSTALHLLTGLPYHREDSDLDLYLKKADGITGPGLWHFFNVLCEIEKAYGIKADPEVEAKIGFGIKLKELFSGQKTVVGKGYYSVDLLYISKLEEFEEDILAFRNFAEGGLYSEY